MSKYISLIRLVVVALAVVILGALLGWYFFLHGKTAQTVIQNTGAGYGVSAPTFQGSTGSTYANVVSTLGAAPGSATSTAARLWEVSAVPVAGFGWQKTSAPTLDFVERSSGYVFEAQTQSRSVVRLTNVLRPKVYEASIALDGGLTERSIDDSGALITFAGGLASSSPSDNASSTPMDLVGTALQTGINAIAIDPVSDTLFYLVPGPSGVSLVSSSLSGTKQRRIFSSAIVGWRLIAPGDGTLVLQQNPLDGSTGYAYQLQKTGTLSLIAQAPGLTVLPRASSSALIFGSSSSGQLSLFVQPSASISPERLAMQTVADKCAWAPGVSLIAYCAAPLNIPSQNFLNDWYKGLVHTSDKFYEIDASMASSTLIYDPTGDTSAQFDVQSMSVDPTGQFLAFINAKDQSLWVLRISQ